MPKKSRQPTLPKSVRSRRAGVRLRLQQLMGGRSQRGWSRELDVPQQNISRYLQGTTPHLDFLIWLAKKERVNLNWLILGEGRMKR